METSEKVNRRKHLLILSPWKGDWDFNSIRSNPENAYLLTGLHKAGFLIHLIFPMEGKKYHIPESFHNLSPQPVRIPHFPRIRKIGVFFLILHYIIVNLKMIREGTKLIRQKRMDLIYGFSSYVAPAVFILGKLYRRPTLLKLYGIYFLLPFKWFSLRYYIENFSTLIAFLLSFNKLIVEDNGTQGDKAAEIFKIPEENFLFWKNPVDKSWIKVKREPKDKTIIAVGNLMRSKGFDLTIRAMARVIEREPSARLLIIGEGPERERLEKIIMRLGLEKNVFLLGAKRHKEILEYYRTAEIMITTNRLSNLRRPVQEAMICGIPVVATDIRDTFKIIKDKETGLLVKSDLGDIVQKILLLWRDKELYKRISEDAKRFAFFYFPSWEHGIEEEITLIYSLCQ